jgi:hypothetical protein
MVLYHVLCYIFLRSSMNVRTLDFLHAVFALHGLYYYLVSHYGETDYLNSLVW